VTIIDSEKEINLTAKNLLLMTKQFHFFLAESILPLPLLPLVVVTARSSNHEFWFSFVVAANNLG